MIRFNLVHGLMEEFTKTAVVCPPMGNYLHTSQSEMERQYNHCPKFRIFQLTFKMAPESIKLVALLNTAMEN